MADIVTTLEDTADELGGSAFLAAAGEVMLGAASEIRRLRAAIDSLLLDIDSDHQPEWASEAAKAAGKQPWCCRLCGPSDGSWPCAHRITLDELKKARHE